ncbi:RNA polymerase II subunit A C-terminal domain phosphatase, putative [Phytophthora infestans T30-4]|uniref:RNA polymerase II subunit A C-terminal domain phosphatase SSU72 n=2 Tax=Phytophthora infestans TaxID=4787 RepID=D0N2F3_PHYIT|nr:RNA polymerase II subunit A C-terminal domain phosphatase, putative [Phytophthora infestans T30-4]EEY68482.1 RNA polymerase II subunit A C-terminal domain phosphatase, putative [Phytophthora infestans T30-4]|eukprot:XP_002905641.1 RNA polymerase II subunit A C-terminal domain phosphatase, putative [Phytophthora infestans T30-4]
MFAMLCANNVNRSTEAHDHLHAAGLRVCSFGAGNRVRFPGPSRDDPRIYEFFTPYETMYRELKAENAELFKRNGVLSMLERDMLTKKCPQRWQDLSVKELQGLDVVLCFDDRIFEIVLEDLQLRGAAQPTGSELTMAWRPLHLLCLDTKDTPEHAKVGGSLALELCQAIDVLNSLNDGIIDAIQDFESRKNVHLLYSLLHV